jgi:hypothetical protein
LPVASNRLNALRLVQGQTKSFLVAVKTKEGRVVNLGSAKLYMSVRRTAGTTVLISKTSGDGIEITDAAKGEATITLETTDTAQLVAGDYRYDVWVEFPGDPPKRQPIVQYAEIHVEDSITEFTS